MLLKPFHASPLAFFACDPNQSRGRRFFEAAAPTRSEYQRDRDRIVHSSAFRRLVYKTQVFLNHEGDLFRTRMTHSLEVAQLARSIARALKLNEDLVEAIALSHDLGHTPFGHAGQDALNACLAGVIAKDSANDDWHGFEHNLQSLRVIDELEHRYAQFDGLNLCFETREGILKHCSPRNAHRLAAAEPGSPAQRFIGGQQPSLEAQLVNLADEMAYNAHDIDDGVRSGLITLAQLEEVPLFVHWRDGVLADHPALAEQPGRRLLFETLRRLLSAQIGSLISHTAQALAAANPADADAARALPPLVSVGPALREQNAELKRFLFRQLYRHPQVMKTTARAGTVVQELFEAYISQPAQMPVEYATAQPLHRSVADYIAGMTDRFALREHARLTGRRLFAD